MPDDNQATETLAVRCDDLLGAVARKSRRENWQAFGQIRIWAETGTVELWYGNLHIVQKWRSVDDAYVALWLEEYEAGDHALSAEDAAALQSAKPDFMRRLREIYQRAPNKGI